MPSWRASRPNLGNDVDQFEVEIEKHGLAVADLVDRKTGLRSMEKDLRTEMNKQAA